MMKISQIIDRILNDNRMGIKITADSLAVMMSDRIGKKVWPYYLNRWRRGRISPKYKKLLLEVYRELCETEW